MDTEPHYPYYTPSTPLGPRRIEEALVLSRKRLHPPMTDEDYLILCERRRLFIEALDKCPTGPLTVLDVGGRLQPYRELLTDRSIRYVAIDPILDGLTDIVGIGEYLPFRRESFDLTICAQVLTYANNPSLLVAEIHRVLRPRGVLFLSAPAFFPRHHDERWRFLPDGLRILLRGFSSTDIQPEGNSLCGLFRTVNICLRLFLQYHPRLWWVARTTLIPPVNLLGRMLHGLSLGNDHLIANYSVIAVK